MTKEDRQKLREAAIVAQAGVRSRTQPSISDGMRWELQTSNSFRRIGQYGDGDVLCAIAQRPDGHPDLLAASGVLDYVVAAQPYVVLELLDRVDATERAAADLLDTIQKLRAEIERMGPTHEMGALIKARDCIDAIILSKRTAR